MNKITLKAGLKKCKTYPFILYRLNELGNIIVILYIDYTLKVVYKPELMNMIEYTKKEYATLSMDVLEDFLGWVIKSDLNKITINIYQPHLINNMTQEFN